MKSLNNELNAEHKTLLHGAINEPFGGERPWRSALLIKLIILREG
jgi:hypothetical protein